MIGGVDRCDQYDQKQQLKPNNLCIKHARKRKTPQKNDFMQFALESSQQHRVAHSEHQGEVG